MRIALNDQEGQLKDSTSTAKIAQLKQYSFYTFRIASIAIRNLSLTRRLCLTTICKSSRVWLSDCGGERIDRPGTHTAPCIRLHADSYHGRSCRINKCMHVGILPSLRSAFNDKRDKLRANEGFHSSTTHLNRLSF